MDMCDDNDSCVHIDKSCYTWKGWYHYWKNWHSFRCLYKDGQKTYRMRYSAAVNLAYFFGGTIVFDPYD